MGVPVAPFPRWMLCPRCRRLAPLSSNLFDPQARRLPARPGEIRPRELPLPRQARPPSSPPASSWPARTATWTTSRGSTSSTAARRTTPTSSNSWRWGRPGRRRTSTSGARPATRPARCRTPSSSTTATCRLPGEAAPPAGLRRGRVQGRAEPADPGPGDDAGGVEHVVPDPALGPVDPAKLEPAEATRDRPLERPLRHRGRGGHRQAAPPQPPAGFLRVPRRRPLGGDPGAAGGGRGGDERRRDRPEDPRVGDLRRPRSCPEDEGLPAPGGPCPRAASPGTSRRSSWSSGCGRCGPWSASPGSSRPATTRARRISPRPSG